MMRISAQRHARFGSTRELQQFDVKILTIRVAVDLDRFIQGSGFRENARPVGRKAEAKVVNATARVTEDVDRRITQRGEVTLGLIFRFAQCGMEGCEDKIKLRKACLLQVAFAMRIQV